MGVNTIGSYAFLQIHGRVVRPLEQHVIEARAGVDGVSLWATGERAGPQRIVTVVDVASEVMAWLLYRNYINLIRSSVPITQNGVSWPDIRYDVLKVEMLAVRNHLAAIGGLYGGSTLLDCAWDILPRRINT